jgi:hypothetical protein
MQQCISVLFAVMYHQDALLVPPCCCSTALRCTCFCTISPSLAFLSLLYVLLTLSGGPAKRQVIDGIVLTKFDTIDDKVGAALSMVYASGAPVMFVGCGQTYVDLKKLNVRSVVNSLLK